MDLGAYVQIPDLEGYVSKHYGRVPRIRGIRLMKLEAPVDERGKQADMFNRHCGEDVVYIHTRCGSAYWGDGNPDANYVACGGADWEKANDDTFIESINDEYDGTYRDHYFKAVVDDEYKRLVNADRSA